jgi:pheromone shutdown protein TraB
VIILVGVGHVFALRDRIKETIHRERPAVVCLELDPARLQALLDEQRRRAAGAPQDFGKFDWRTIGRGGLIYAFIARTQRRLAVSFGSSVGDEMLAALEAAREVGARTELIDMDSTVFVNNWMGRLTRRERLKLFLSAFGGVFASRKRVEKEMAEYHSNEDAFIEELARHFPGTKTALIDERNAYMAKGITRSRQLGGVVVAIVGEGHLSGIKQELIKAGQPPDEIRVVSLAQLRAPSEPGLAPRATNAEFSVSFGASDVPPGGPIRGPDGPR